MRERNRECEMICEMICENRCNLMLFDADIVAA
jgi:hypothetical protein